MMELTIGQLIKIILGILVVVAVVVGFYLFFQDKLVGFIENLPGNSSELFLSILN
jgi:hypothetical protein